MVASTESRLLFVNSAIDFLRKYDFDGLDLDWEYPTRRGGRPEDKENFAKLVKVLFFMMMKLYPEVVSILGMIKQSKSFIQYLWIFLGFFLQLLREAFDREAGRTGRPVLLLSAAVPTSKELVDQAYDIITLGKYVYLSGHQCKSYIDIEKTKVLWRI